MSNAAMRIDGGAGSGRTIFMSGAKWLALLCRHILDRYERLVRYVGWYSDIGRRRGSCGSEVADGIAYRFHVDAPEAATASGG